MSREILFQETLQALEWPKLLEILAAQAHSALGADFCRALPLADTFSLAQKQIQETARGRCSRPPPNRDGRIGSRLTCVAAL